MTRDEYLKQRSLTIYHIGCIFYQKLDYYHAVAYLYPILEDLYKGKYHKQLANAEKKVSKIWRLNFNERTIKWDYFSVKNMENFHMLDGMRKAEKATRDKKEKEKREANADKLLRQYSVQKKGEIK